MFHDSFRPARLLPHKDGAWVIGGAWGAGGAHAHKPKSFVALAKEESFDPKVSSAVWLQQEEQVGFFVWQDKPPKLSRKTHPLAAAAARKLSSKQYPFVGIFNLGDNLWWLFSSDSNGAVHPVWGDIYGTRDEIDRYVSEHAAQLASSAGREEIPDADEAWAWLLSDDQNVESIRHVTGGALDPKAAVALALAVGVVAVGVVGGKMLIGRDARDQAALAQQAAAAQARLAEIARLDKERKHQEAKRRVEAFWASYPKPWEQQHYDWTTMLGACQIGKTSNGHGWTLSRLECSVSPSGATITRKWQRGRFASVLDKPEGGVMDESGDTAVVSGAHPLDAAGGVPVLPSVSDARLKWLDLSKKQFGAAMSLQVGQMQPFRPPFPPNTPPEVQKEMVPPILWHQMDVKIGTFNRPGGREHVFQSEGFLPTSAESSVADSGNLRVNWSTKGVQYAK